MTSHRIKSPDIAWHHITWFYHAHSGAAKRRNPHIEGAHTRVWAHGGWCTAARPASQRTSTGYCFRIEMFHHTAWRPSLFILHQWGPNRFTHSLLHWKRRSEGWSAMWSAAQPIWSISKTSLSSFSRHRQTATSLRSFYHFVSNSRRFHVMFWGTKCGRFTPLAQNARGHRHNTGVHSRRTCACTAVQHPRIQRCVVVGEGVMCDHQSSTAFNQLDYFVAHLRQIELHYDIPHHVICVLRIWWLLCLVCPGANAAEFCASWA